MQKVSDRMAKLLGEAAEEANEVWMDVPLFIRLLEFAREDSHDDVDLHDVAQAAVRLTGKKNVRLSMDDYDALMPPGHKLADQKKSAASKKAD